MLNSLDCHHPFYDIMSSHVGSIRAVICAPVETPSGTQWVYYTGEYGEFYDRQRALEELEHESWWRDSASYSSGEYPEECYLVVEKVEISHMIVGDDGLWRDATNEEVEDARYAWMLELLARKYGKVRR
jgi:hypothetical protein